MVIGGDGFMLKTLKKNINQKRSFYGINSGDYGFLMNKFSKNLFKKNLIHSKLITIHPLEMTVIRKKIKKFCHKRSLNKKANRQAANLLIKNNSKKIIKKLVSDGALLSTQLAVLYNLSVHGPILNLNSKKISIAPISPFRPEGGKENYWDKSKITIINLDPNKRPVSAVADNVEIRNARKIIIKVNNKVSFNLLYDKNVSLQKKIKLEQLEMKHHN